MPRPSNLIRIFLASPGDVKEERAIARNVITEVNRSIAIPNGFTLQAIGWETDTMPAMGGDAQSIINAQVFDSDPHDLFVGIMWNRVGTETPRAGSGTEEEFRQAMESRKRSGLPHVMFYFCKRPAYLGTKAEIDQRSKVITFEAELQASGLTWHYNEPQEFERLFREHLTKAIVQLKDTPTKSKASTPLEPTAKPQNDRAQESQASKHWMLLKDRFFEFESVDDDGAGNLTVRLPQPPPEAEAILRAFQNGTTWGKPPVPYAYDLEGGLASVAKAERSAKGGAATWILSLKVLPSEQGNGVEFSINGVSADQIAEKRARMILLGESPQPGDSLIGTMFPGGAHGKIPTGILTPLWTQLSDDPDLFSKFGRLLGVYHLKVTQILEHIFELQIDISGPDTARVKLRGERKQPYTNKRPTIISLEGECRLTNP